jgi:hypothetical protein
MWKKSNPKNKGRIKEIIKLNAAIMKLPLIFGSE